MYVYMYVYILDSHAKFVQLEVTFHIHKVRRKKRRLEKLDFLCQFVSFSWTSISNQSNAHNLGLNLSRFLPILDQIKTRPPWEINLWLSISLLAFYFLPKSICLKKANKWAIMCSEFGNLLFWNKTNKTYIELP